MPLFVVAVNGHNKIGTFTAMSYRGSNDMTQAKATGEAVAYALGVNEDSTVTATTAIEILPDDIRAMAKNLGMVEPPSPKGDSSAMWWTVGIIIALASAVVAGLAYIGIPPQQP